MEFTINMLGSEMVQLLQYCKEHFACRSCEIYQGSNIQIGNTIFTCENYGKGQDNGSEVQE